jgi:hypothetical protein
LLTSRFNAFLVLINAAYINDCVPAFDIAWAVVVVDGSGPRDVSRRLRFDGVVVLGHYDDSLGRTVASGMDLKVSKDAEADTVMIIGCSNVQHTGVYEVRRVPAHSL